MRISRRGTRLVQERQGISLRHLVSAATAWARSLLIRQRASMTRCPIGSSSMPSASMPRAAAANRAVPLPANGSNSEPCLIPYSSSSRLTRAAENASLKRYHLKTWRALTVLEAYESTSEAVVHAHGGRKAGVERLCQVCYSPERAFVDCYYHGLPSEHPSRLVPCVLPHHPRNRATGACHSKKHFTSANRGGLRRARDPRAATA